MLGNIMNALAQPGNQQMLTQVVGGLLGGGQQGGAPANQLLSGLEQVIGGNPTSGQLSANQGTAPAANSPLAGLLGPIANAVAGSTGISPAIATTVAATAMHYLVASHPASSPSAPLNLPEVTHQMVTGGVSPQVLQSSGMVNAVVQATGLSQQAATQSLTATFNHLATHVDKERLAGKQKAKRDDR
jgi:hypothetical protein